MRSLPLLWLHVNSYLGARRTDEKQDGRLNEPHKHAKTNTCILVCLGTDRPPADQPIHDTLSQVRAIAKNKYRQGGDKNNHVK